MQDLAKFHDGCRYILTCIDVFTKKAHAVTLKYKRGSTVTEALGKIFDFTITKCKHLSKSGT